MKVNDCKTIRCEIEESCLDQKLDANVLGHINECSSCREFYESDKKLRQMMAGLVPVEAPADFDFRLRARIAREQTQTRPRLPFGSVSLALPSAAVALLILVVGGVFVFRNVNTPAPNRTVVVEHPPVVTPTTPNDSTVAVAPVSSPEVTVQANPQRRKPVQVEKRQLAGSRQRDKLVFEDSSSVGATSLSQPDIADGSAPLTFPVQTLKVSVDDGSGVSRTISIPTVSFGSQRTLAGAGSSFQPAARNDW